VAEEGVASEIVSALDTAEHVAAGWEAVAGVGRSVVVAHAVAEEHDVAVGDFAAAEVPVAAAENGAVDLVHVGDGVGSAAAVALVPDVVVAGKVGLESLSMNEVSIQG
jgi:hypothetical protein